MPQSYRDLEVWKCAVELAMLVYKLTNEFPKHETYGLSSQMRRAAVSIASNLAEGSARSTRKDFRQFVTIARGSNCELQTQLLIAGGLHYSSSESIREAEVLSHKVGRMLNGLSKFLKSSYKPGSDVLQPESRRTHSTPRTENRQP